jgi:3-hydroxyacyl-[acyl-carrier-protein] dehydratase
MNDVFRQTFRIAADHPVLAGHFPGNPVVPGVVMLDRVAAALEAWRNQRVAEFPQVKFLLPLLPDQDALLVLTTDGDNARFVIERDTQCIAKGVIVSAPMENER